MKLIDWHRSVDPWGCLGVIVVLAGAAVSGWILIHAARFVVVMLVLLERQ